MATKKLLLAPGLSVEEFARGSDGRKGRGSTVEERLPRAYIEAIQRLRIEMGHGIKRIVRYLEHPQNLGPGGLEDLGLTHGMVQYYVDHHPSMRRDRGQGKAGD